jgi:hypothetical protein
MAMSNCKECGKAVSTLAKTCPSCGVPKPAQVLKKKTSTKKTISKSKKEKPNVSSLIWAHCSNRKCKEYTQMYQFKKSELAATTPDVYKTCNVCKNYFKKANIESGRPIMPTDGTYKSPTISYKSDTELNTKKNMDGKKDWVHIGSGDYLHKPNRGSTDKFFDGDLDLGTAFWIYGVILSTVIGFVSGLLNELIYPMFEIPYIIAQIAIIIFLWQCSEHHKKIKTSKDESVVWGILTQVYCVFAGFGAIGFVFDAFK